jgi:branched-chain amino acid aminotransferase
MSPPAPLSTIDWEKLGLAINDSVNGHVEAIFSLATGEWSTPTFVKDPYLRVHGLAPGLNYGMQVYEGLKACRLASGAISIFRPTFHAKRMAHSAEVVSMPEVPEALFLRCITEAVRRNAEFVGPHSTNAVLYIRPLLFGSGPQLALEVPSEITFAVYVQPATTYHGVQPLPCLVMEDFDRSATRGTGSAKVGGNYAPVMKYSRAAKAQGFYMTLHLDSATQTEIDEFSTSGFIGVKKRQGSTDEKPTLVVPDSRNVLGSVTSDSCMEVARSLGWKVEKRTVKFAELADFEEVLAVGTAASVLPIAAIVRKSTGDKFVYCPDGKPGPVGVELSGTLRKYIRGEVKDQFGWCYEVDFPEQKKSRIPPPLMVDNLDSGLTAEQLAMVMSPI